MTWRLRSGVFEGRETIATHPSLYGLEYLDNSKEDLEKT